MVHEFVPHVVYALARVEPSHASLLGTAFVVAPGVLATTRHVVGDSDQNLVVIAPRVHRFSEYQDTSAAEVQTAGAQIHAIDPIRDICLVTAPISLTPSYRIDTSDNAPPGAQIVTFGFPHADHGRLVLTQQNTQVGARVLIESSGIKSKHIVLNTQARTGQSGSPVFLADDPAVVAMVIGSYAPGGGGGISLGGIDPHTLHQTTHAVSAEYIRDML